MDIRLLRLFQGEVERQCRFAVMASRDIERSLATQNNDLLWYSVQAFLVAVGNMSRLLWPPRPRLPGRGEALRESLSVSGDSPLEPRHFRNHFEHFDERLEEWAEASREGAFVDSNVGLGGRVAGAPQRSWLRNFESATWAVTFRGDRYHLRQLLPEIHVLRACAAIEAARP